jgi:GT2 family glycosyltransferase
MKYSIIIPTYNRVDILKQCIDSIIANTSISVINSSEIIVVSNGCKDGTVDYVNSLGSSFKLVRWEQPLGYAKAINLGAAVATGEYLILLNNDSQLLNSNWISMLEEPFTRFTNVCATGPSSLTRAGIPWLIFFCVMIKRNVFAELGYLDESFGAGGGEDTDFCIKAYFKGYTNYMVPLFQGNLTSPGRPFLFPIYHIGGVTCNTIPNMAEITKANEARLTQLYGPP